METNPVREALARQLFGVDRESETHEEVREEVEGNETTQNNQGDTHDNVSVIRGILTSVLEESAREEREREIEEEERRRREREEELERRRRQQEEEERRMERQRELRREEEERQRQREEDARRLLQGIKFNEGFGNENTQARKGLNDEELLSRLEETMSDRNTVGEVKTRSRLVTELNKIKSEGRAEYQRKLYMLDDGVLRSLQTYKGLGIVKGKESVSKLRSDATSLMTGVDTELIPKLKRFEVFRYTPEVFYVGKTAEGVTLRLMFNNLFSFEEFSRDNEIPDVVVKQPMGLFEVKVEGNIVKSIRVFKTLIEVFDTSSPFVSEVANYDNVNEDFDGKRIKSLDNIRNLQTTDLIDLGDNRRDSIIKFIREGEINYD